MGWVNDTDTKRAYDSKPRPVGSGWIDRHGPDPGGSRVPSWRALDPWEAENALWELRRYPPLAAHQLQRFWAVPGNNATLMHWLRVGCSAFSQI
jgi:hypothetical protein